METDPVERMSRGSGPRSLFDALDVVENAILNGQALELRRRANPFGDKVQMKFQAWPLQLLHYDIAWYFDLPVLRGRSPGCFSHRAGCPDDYRVLSEQVRFLSRTAAQSDSGPGVVGKRLGGYCLGNPKTSAWNFQGRLEPIEVQGQGVLSQSDGVYF